MGEIVQAKNHQAHAGLGEITRVSIAAVARC